MCTALTQLQRLCRHHWAIVCSLVVGATGAASVDEAIVEGGIAGARVELFPRSTTQPLGGPSFKSKKE